MNTLKQLILLHTIVLTGFPSIAQRNGVSVLDRINAFNMSFTEGMKRGATEGFMDFYSDSVRLMPAFQPTILGKENTGRYYSAWVRRFRVQSYSRETMEVLDLGQSIVETGKFSVTVSTAASNVSQTLEGKYMTIWLKESGNVSLFTDAWNYNSYYGDFHQHLKFDEVPSVIVAFGTQSPVDDPVSFELAALNQLHGVTVSQGDANRWSQFYAEDVVLMPNFFPPLTGRTAVDGYINTHVKELPIFEKLDIRNDRIDALGDFMIEYASHIAHWRSGEFSGVSTGKDLRIWKRQPDCSLKMIRQIGMYD